MKKQMFFILLLSIILGGCGNYSSSDERIQQESIPFDADFEEQKVTFNNIKFYQDYSDAQHGYFLYAIASFQLNDFSDDDIYWFDKNNSLSLDLYITSTDNSMDYKSMNVLSKFIIGSTYYITFHLSDAFRYTFEDSEYDVSLTLEKNNEKCYEAYCINQTIPSTLFSTDNIEKRAYNSMLEGLQRIQEDIESLY